MAQQSTPTQATRRDARSTCLATAASRLSSTVHPHDWPAAGSRSNRQRRMPDDASASDRAWIRTGYRLLLRRGLSTTEACNVVAWVAGLHAVEGGWSTRQIERLVALRARVACGVVTP